jgi:uncharacterized membrane-anchored protein YhcB (DUF1043 family)
MLVAVLAALVVAVLIGMVIRRLGQRWPVSGESARRGRLRSGCCWC